MATRPYQGYPFTNPHVTDAPSVDAATASRWNDLPRRPLQPAPPPPKVYVDLPEDGSQVSRPKQSGKSSDAEPEPVIYIDVPDSDGSDVAGPATTPQFIQPPKPSVKTPDSEPDPVIYIDVPENGSNDVAGPATPELEPEYVRETIFYDPFENRRIDRQKPSGTPDPGAGAGPSRPSPPNTMELNGAGSSGYGSSFNTPTPAYLSKEASLYGDFNLSPLPVSPYRDPPPAYTETATPHTPHTPPESMPAEPPRTVVITPGSRETHGPSIGLPSPQRKQLYCQHCGHRVYTLVVLEAGPITHCMALFTCIVMLWPLLPLVYCTNWYKYKNHYCPNCSKRVGYEMPCLCISMTYTKS